MIRLFFRLARRTVRAGNFGPTFVSERFRQCSILNVYDDENDHEGLDGPFADDGNVRIRAGSAPTAAPKERPTTEQMARKATERMTLRLKLTDEQARQVYEAVLERMRATEALREQARAAKSAEAERMKSILSTEQFVRWAQSQVPHDRRRGPQAGRKERPDRSEAPKDRRERR